MFLNERYYFNWFVKLFKDQGGSREYRKARKDTLRPLPPFRSLRYSRLPLYSAMLDIFEKPGNTFLFIRKG